jgi:hypothetical protein
MLLVAGLALVGAGCEAKVPASSVETPAAPSPAAVAPMALKFETKTASRQKEGIFMASSAVPRLTGGADPAAMAAINAAIDASVAELRKDFDAGVAEMLKDPSAVGAGQWFLELNGKVVRSDAALVTVAIEASVYTGGAHPNTYYASVMADPKTGKRLGTLDVLQPGVLPKLAAKAGTLVTNAYKAGDIPPDAKWIAEGVAPTEANYAWTHLSDQGLELVFPAYQVAPYAFGPQKYTISYLDAKDLVKSEYLK